MKILKAPTKKVLNQQIKSINIASAAISAVLAVVSAFFLVPTTVNFVLNYMARDELAAGSSVVLAPAGKVLSSPQIGYVLAGIFLIMAVCSLLLATKLKDSYNKTVKNATSGYRWLLVGISAGLLLEFTSLIAGITDVMTLKLIFGMILVAAIFGWISDRDNKGSKNAKWLAYAVSLVAVIVAWTPLAGSLFGTWFYGLERFGWQVYALAAVLLVGFTTAALTQYYHFSGKKGWKDYVFVERNFLAVDLGLKVVAGVIVVVAYLQ